MVVLVPALVILAWLAGAAERGSFENYPVYPYAQGLSATGFVGPLVAGWSAWTFGALQTVARSRPVMRRPVIMAAHMLWPGVLAGFLVVQLLAIFLSRAQAVAGGIQMSLVVVVCLVACASVGAATGLLLPRIVAAPVILVATFLWLAYPISSFYGWLRTSNTVSALQSCCTSETQVSHTWFAASLAVTGVWITGLALLLTASAQRLMLLRAGAVIVLALGVLLGSIIGRDATFNGLEPRRSDLYCASNAAGLRWCVWPEDRQFSGPTGDSLTELTATVQRLTLPAPTTWSTSTTNPPDAAALTVLPAGRVDQQRAAFAIATVQWWRCQEDAEAKLTAWLLISLGVPEKRGQRSVEPAAWAVAKAHRGTSGPALQYWKSAIRESCQRGR